MGGHRRRQQLARQHARGRRGGDRRRFPVPLRYAFEKEQGRSAALNYGFRIAHGEIIVTTDDDVRVEPDWLDTHRVRPRDESSATTSAAASCRSGSRRRRAGFRGPTAACGRSSRCSTTAPTPIRFGARVPLGVNMAMRREAIERVGGFDTAIGRKAGTLLGQEVREWCLRAPAAGLTGYYIPAIVVAAPDSRRPAEQGATSAAGSTGAASAARCCTRRPASTWRAPEQSTLDFSQVPHVAGVPRYLFRSAVAARPRRRSRATLRRDPITAFERELWLWLFAGIVAQRWHDRGQRGNSAGPRRERSRALSRTGGDCDECRRRSTRRS